MSSTHSEDSLLHPASGAIILALDWILFSGNALSLGLGTGVLAFVGFVLGLLSVGFVQYRYGHEPMIASGLKGVLAGAAVGIPFPIAGTAVGGLVLTLSGLDRWKKRLLPGRSQGTPSEPTEESPQSSSTENASRGGKTRSSN
jgi:hypothetical protein